MKYLYSLLAVALISSCASNPTPNPNKTPEARKQKFINDVNTEWVGQTEQTLISVYGIPDIVYNLDKTKYVSFMLDNPLTPTLTVTCEITFILENNLIIGSNIKGPNCY